MKKLFGRFSQLARSCANWLILKGFKLVPGARLELAHSKERGILNSLELLS